MEFELLVVCCRCSYPYLFSSIFHNKSHYCGGQHVIPTAWRHVVTIQKPSKRNARFSPSMTARCPGLSLLMSPPEGMTPGDTSDHDAIMPSPCKGLCRGCMRSRLTGGDISSGGPPAPALPCGCGIAAPASKLVLTRKIFFLKLLFAPCLRGPLPLPLPPGFCCCEFAPPNPDRPLPCPLPGAGVLFWDAGCEGCCCCCLC